MIFFRRTEKYRLSHLKSERRGAHVRCSSPLSPHDHFRAMRYLFWRIEFVFFFRTKTDGTFAHYDIHGVDSN